MNTPVPEFTEIALELPQPVDRAVARKIEVESGFVAEALDRIEIDPDGRSARLILDLTDELDDVDTVIAKAKRFLARVARCTDGAEIEILIETERNDGGPQILDVEAGLVERGWLKDYGGGQIACVGPVSRLADLVSERSARLFNQWFGAEDARFPALTGVSALHRCGVLEDRPHAPLHLGHLVGDFDAIEEYRAANACCDRALLPPRRQVRMNGLSLCPSASIAAFPMLSGRDFETGACLTWTGRTFRNAGYRFAGLDRLSETDVRTLLFVGHENHVRDCHARALAAIGALAELFDLDCRVVSEKPSHRTSGDEAKARIVMPVTGENGAVREIDCGMVTLDGSRFGETFSMSAGSDKPAWSGCVELTLESWLLAACCQHGFAPDRWPDWIGNRIFG